MVYVASKHQPTTRCCLPVLLLPASAHNYATKFAPSPTPRTELKRDLRLETAGHCVHGSRRPPPRVCYHEHCSKCSALPPADLPTSVDLLKHAAALPVLSTPRSVLHCVVQHQPGWAHDKLALGSWREPVLAQGTEQVVRMSGARARCGRAPCPLRRLKRRPSRHQSVPAHTQQHTPGAPVCAPPVPDPAGNRVHSPGFLVSCPVRPCSITARPAFRARAHAASVHSDVSVTRGSVSGPLAETPHDAAGIGEEFDVLRRPSGAESLRKRPHL
ncbi:hypothetical protein B0H15DRAFT_952682 [Mycena belliarum]|uniref:Uncharacterized protein n=1 Tax=Mycena belliarum TaxID=1033014 RepID=A0AAD6U1V2_9AGAR|nr:hypothetical protein B0H15DRAFT_952682 [Mycena belliae]